MATKESRYTAELIVEETPHSQGRVNIRYELVLHDNDDPPEEGFADTRQRWYNISTFPLNVPGFRNLTAPMYTRRKAVKRFKKWLPKGTTAKTLGSNTLLKLTNMEMSRLELQGALFLKDMAVTGIRVAKKLPKKKRKD